MKVEQRIGRIDRIGQKHPVKIFNFSTKGTIEERVVDVLTRRIGLFKETPLLAAITVIDVFGAANNIAGQTYRYNEPYTAAAIILLAVSLIAVALVRHMERHLAPKSQKRGPVAEGKHPAY